MQLNFFPNEDRLHFSDHEDSVIGMLDLMLTLVYSEGDEHVVGMPVYLYAINLSSAVQEIDVS